MQNIGVRFSEKNRQHGVMGTSTSKTNRHVFNNSDLDIQIYEIPKSMSKGQVHGRPSTAKSDDLDGGYLAGAVLAGMNRVSVTSPCLGTVPARSSKSLNLPVGIQSVIICARDIHSIRQLPVTRDIVIEMAAVGLASICISSFSRIHHVALPSLLMNLDSILPTSQTPRLDGKSALNRTLSTAVPSPNSTPSRQSSVVSPAAAARAACVMASVFRYWRNSEQPVTVKELIHGSVRRLEAVKRGRFGECIVIIGQICVSVGHLDIEWNGSRMPLEYTLGEDLVMKQRDVYAKLLCEAKAILECDNPSSCEVLDIVGKGQSDISILLAGALVLNDIRETSTCHGSREYDNPPYFTLSPPA